MPDTTEAPALSPSLLDYQLQLLVPTLILGQVFLAPYTKVEESFNIQALHDWLLLGPSRIQEWDHILFPGAVPRSFIPSFLLAALSYLPLVALKALGLIQTSADLQLALRCLQGLCVSSALLFFLRRVSKAIDVSALLPGSSEGQLQYRRWIHRSLLITTLVQFRLPYWASRTIPNSLAMPLVLVALALILPRGSEQQRTQLTGISILVFATAVYRLELAALLGASGLYVLHGIITGPRNNFDPHPVENIAKLAGITHASATVSALLSTGVDSWLWRSRQDGRGWIWPELEALNFNVVQGKSEEWGVSPWYFYLTSAVPGVLGFTVPLAVIGIVLVTYATARRQKIGAAPDKHAALTAEPSFSPLAPLWLSSVHVALLSGLAHKEWRFVMYVGPLLNILAAVAAATCISGSFARSATSSRPLRLIKRFVVPLVPVGCWALSLAVSLLILGLSTHNYPGGEALRWLHKQIPGPAVVHIDVPAAMSGVTLFQSVHHPDHGSTARARSGAFGLSFLPSVLPRSDVFEGAQVWTYDKSEDLPPLNSSSPALPAQWAKFDFLLLGQPCPVPYFEPMLKADNGDGRPEAREQARTGVKGLIAVFHEAAGLWIQVGRKPSQGWPAPAATKPDASTGYIQRLDREDGDVGNVSGHIISEGWDFQTSIGSLANRASPEIVYILGYHYRQRVWVCKRPQDRSSQRIQ